MTSAAPPLGRVRVRFAPSPTGNLHLGGARTALYNWLFARHLGGTFILRIEDTDRERSRQEYVHEILSSLEWLGLCRDEGPYFQSRRPEVYRRAAARLQDEGKAYLCFCTPQELDERRKKCESSGGAYRYDGRCAALGTAEIEERRRAGVVPALRLKVPPGASRWDDLIRGSITIDHAQLDDFVIVKGDGSPTYHFAAAVDDVDLNITHVIRGDDHISNTPKQLVVYQALGAAPPVFAHIPLIHGTDGGRLSKRHGATAVLDYRKQGFVPEALVNYLALLGWSPGNDREIMSMADMVSLFDLSRVVPTPAVFDMEKLTWMNSLYLASLSTKMKTLLVIPYLQAAGLITEADSIARIEWIEEVVAAMGDRLKLLADIVPYSRFLFSDRVEPDDKAAAVIGKAASRRESFLKVHDRLRDLPAYRRGPIEEVIRGVAAEDSVGAGSLIQPIRAAISGSLVTPGLFESLELLGKERSLERIKRFLLPD